MSCVFHVAKEIEDRQGGGAVILCTDDLKQGIVSRTAPVSSGRQQSLMENSRLCDSPDPECRKKRLEWRNLNQRIPVSRDDALKTDHWQLVELHRDAKHNLPRVIDGKDVTVGSPRNKLPFVFMSLFKNKRQEFAKQDSFAGDVAALVIYRDKLGENNKATFRNYLGKT